MLIDFDGAWDLGAMIKLGKCTVEEADSSFRVEMDTVKGLLHPHD